MTTVNWKPILINSIAVLGSFALSFIAFGLLWIGTAWHYQVLMLFPFFVFSYLISKSTSNEENLVLWLMLLGMMPIGSIVCLFRDQSDSNLISILVVLTWIIGIVGGYYLDNYFRKKQI